MAGFILGTGGGILAAAGVYYTLSTSLSQSVASLRTDLRCTSRVLDRGFDPDPTPPPAPSSFVGPGYTTQPKFSDTLRQRWNIAVSRLTSGIQSTDFTATASALVLEGRDLAVKIGQSESIQKVEQGIKDSADKIRKTGEEIERKVEAGSGGDVGQLGLGVVGGSLRGESYTGGNEVYVKAKRETERREGVRLV